MNESLAKRKREVLYAVVHDYIMSAEPVGSSQVAKRKGIELSSATIRIVMAELEERGFLKRSHASSGRVPTTQGYRFYVDNLVRPRAVTKAERSEIRKSVESGETSGMGKVLHEAIRLLTDKAHRTGLALAPKAEERSLKHIQFVRMRGNLLLAILVTGNGIVENKILELAKPLSQVELNRMHNYLNEKLSGLTISAVRKQILAELQMIHNQYDQSLQQALLLGEKTLADGPRDNFLIEGQNYLFTEPDLANVEKMQQILRTLEEKTLLLRLFDESLIRPGVKIFIGDETEFPEINGLTLITSAYSDSEGNQGILGVLGPTRMNYARIVPLVDYTSHILTETLKDSKS